MSVFLLCHSRLNASTDSRTNVGVRIAIQMCNYFGWFDTKSAFRSRFYANHSRLTATSPCVVMINDKSFHRLCFSLALCLCSQLKHFVRIISVWRSPKQTREAEADFDVVNAQVHRHETCVRCLGPIKTKESKRKHGVASFFDAVVVVITDDTDFECHQLHFTVVETAKSTSPSS